MNKHHRAANTESMRCAPMRNFADIIAQGLTAGDKVAKLHLERALLACVGHPLPETLAKTCVDQLKKRNKNSALKRNRAFLRQAKTDLARTAYADLKEYVDSCLRSRDARGHEPIIESIRLGESPHEATLRLVAAVYLPGLAPRTVGNLLRLRASS